MHNYNQSMIFSPQPIWEAIVVPYLVPFSALKLSVCPRSLVSAIDSHVFIQLFCRTSLKKLLGDNCIQWKKSLKLNKNDQEQYFLDDIFNFQMKVGIIVDKKHCGSKRMDFLKQTF